MLNIRTQKLGNTTILHCVGQVTFPYVDALQGLALQEAHQCLILDLASATGIDAAGLGVLVSLRSWTGRTGEDAQVDEREPQGAGSP